MDDLSRKIEVMEACRAGKLIEWKNRSDGDSWCEQRGKGDFVWNWGDYDYRIVSDSSPAIHEKLPALPDALALLATKVLRNTSRVLCMGLFKEPTYTELQAKWLSENDISVGSRVKIGKLDHKMMEHHGGWGFKMEDSEGKVGFVKMIGDDYIRVAEDDEDGWSWAYPYTCLEKVVADTPWVMADVPPVCWIRAIAPYDNRNEALVVDVNTMGIGTVARRWTYEELLTREYSTDRITWKRCVK